MISTLKMALPLIVATALAGCFIPEDIDAEIELTGYAYKIQADGALLSVLAAQSIVSGVPITAEDLEALEEIAEKYRTDARGIKALTNLGQGRFELAFAAQGVLDAENNAVGIPSGIADSADFLLMARDDKGNIRIGTQELTDENIEILSPLPTKLKLAVKTDGEVIAHNADSEPGLLGEAYQWEITSWDRPISIIIKPKADE